MLLLDRWQGIPVVHWQETRHQVLSIAKIYHYQEGFKKDKDLSTGMQLVGTRVHGCPCSGSCEFFTMPESSGGP